MKKIICLVLALIMAVGALSVTAFANVYVKPSDAVWFDKDNKTTWWMFDDDEGYLTLGGKGEIPESPYAWQSKEKYRKEIETVEIKNGVTKIGKKAFADCVNLTVIEEDFPASLTEIGESAFAGSSLNRLCVPRTLEIIGKTAFKNCKNLKYVEFKDVPASIAGDAFEGVGTAKKPATLVIPDKMEYVVDKDGKWNGGYFELANKVDDDDDDDDDDDYVVVITGEKVKIEKRTAAATETKPADKNTEVNPNTGAPVLNMGSVLILLGAAAIVLKKH